jgi:hypothetical protein
MAVKDLVGLFDTPSSDSDRGHILDARRSSENLNCPPELDVLRPSPARFIHPTRVSRSVEPIPLHTIHQPFTNHDETALHDSPTLINETLNTSTDITDGLKQGVGAAKSHQPSRRKHNSRNEFTQNAGPASSERELEALSPFGRTFSIDNFTVAASSPTLVPQNEVPSKSAQIQRHNFRPHTPIPATVVFAPGAPPLFLPKLDERIESLPLTSFLLPVIKGKDSERAMFSPMDRLVASKRSIQDLENNSGIIPAWGNRRTILSALVNMMLGLLVCIFA